MALKPALQGKISWRMQNGCENPVLKKYHTTLLIIAKTERSNFTQCYLVNLLLLNFIVVIK